MGITIIPEKADDNNIPKIENMQPRFESQDEESISFVEGSSECCVGIVDIVGSTKTTAGMSHVKIGKYYSVFLSTMAPIVKRFGGIVVKNGGDSILYYFQKETVDEKDVFLRCLECSLAMIEARCIINSKLYEEKIPPLSFRVSADYGRVTLAQSSNLSYHDIFGTPVNICSKINGKAQPNTMVVGGDLYRAIKDLPGYHFHEVSGYSVGFKFQYPVYNVTRNEQQCRSLVEAAIERTLLDIGTPTLDAATSMLFNRYNCLFSGCYERPECLKEILMNVFGNAHTSVVEQIRYNLGDHIRQKPILDFVVKLSR